MKRNTGEVVEFEIGEDFGRSSEAEDLARPVVQSIFDRRELLVSDEVEVRSLGQVLADQAIGVLVGTAAKDCEGHRRRCPCEDA